MVMLRYHSQTWEEVEDNGEHDLPDNSWAACLPQRAICQYTIPFDSSADGRAVLRTTCCVVSTASLVVVVVDHNNNTLPLFQFHLSTASLGIDVVVVDDGN